MGAGRRHLGPDAVAHRAGLPRRRSRGPARLLGSGQQGRSEHASSAGTAARKALVSARALVIGAGPNGLAAAIRLAEAGVETTVLEGRSQPGGAVRTEELTLPGFRHDTFSSVYPAAAASPVFGRLPLADYGLV